MTNQEKIEKVFKVKSEEGCVVINGTFYNDAVTFYTCGEYDDLAIYYGDVRLGHISVRDIANIR